MNLEREDGRTPDALRPLTFHRGYTRNAEGSVLVEAGGTRVLCTVCATPGVPPWRKDSGAGWLTAEYAMLPGSVPGRKRREIMKRDGRSVEIQRLIGRVLRATVDLEAVPNWTLAVDCDVLQADGGTRCAAISGAMVALHDALRALSGGSRMTHWPLRHWLAAVSVGVVDGTPMLDLDYGEDKRAEVDMNVVATRDGRLVEVQGTAEGEPFDPEVHDRLVELALAGIGRIAQAQREAVDDAVAS